MIRVIAILALLAATAQAEIIKVPAGWKHDLARSDEVTARPARYFGEIEATARIDLYRAPDKLGALWVTRAVAQPPATELDAAASRQVAELRNEAQRHQGERAVIAIGAPTIRDKTIDAFASWRDPAIDLRQRTQMVLASDGARIVLVRGECMGALTAPAATMETCEAALRTLDPEIPVDHRVVLTLAGEQSITPPPPLVADPGDRGNLQLSPQLRDGDNVKLAPLAITPSRQEADRRPIYLGLGILILALAFWLNRRSRERFDRSDADERGPNRREAAAEDDAEPATDDDAEDLHAAARGDGEKDRA